MSTAHPVIEIEYPESDGQPMGESDLHRDWMFQIIERLKRRYAGQQVYVTGNLIFYYVEGDSKQCIVPDAFVVLGASPHRRKIYKLWEEQRVPSVVFEVTSSSTRWNDLEQKPELYARLGIQELFLYDPTAEYLEPSLQGHRLEGDGYTPITSDAEGALVSEQLGIRLLLAEGDLVMRDQQTNEIIKSAAEAAEAAEEKVRELEAELARRRSQEKSQSGGSISS